MTGGTTIRWAKAEDAEALLMLNRRVADDAAEFLAYDIDPATGAEMLQAKLGDLDLSGAGDGVLVADAGDGALVGAALLRRHRHPAFDGVLQIAISVDPDWRKRGVGRSLMHSAKEAAHAAGARRIQAAIIDGNTAARVLFESAGFTPEGRLVGAARIDGKLRDVLALAYRI